MLRCLSEGVDIFLKSVERQGARTRYPRQPSHGWSEQEVQGIRTLLWMATGAVPVRIRTAVSLFIRKFTPGDATSRRDVPFAAGVRGVYGNPTLRAMHSIHKCVAKGAPHLFH